MLCQLHTNRVHVRRHIARALGIPASKIRVIKPRIGGGFGSKQTACTEFDDSLCNMEITKAMLFNYTIEQKRKLALLHVMPVNGISA